jgi:hypothetical protein
VVSDLLSRSVLLRYFIEIMYAFGQLLQAGFNSASR